MKNKSINLRSKNKNKPKKSAPPKKRNNKTKPI